MRGCVSDARPDAGRVSVAIASVSSAVKLLIDQDGVGKGARTLLVSRGMELRLRSNSGNIERTSKNVMIKSEG